ncbi:MAG TPA: efflux RND transporter periplasmic adaptor subunit [Acidobacteriota bacterium]|jgi:HlyD family secretion protein|nr:efflux RND transporter periplasmic adaptor subunit [Acidobacteriota bacterium]
MARKKSRKILLWLLVLIVIGGLGVYSFTVISRPKNTIDPSRLAAVERGDLARSVVATGRIEPISKVEIKSKANGIIKELKVEAGDLVREGQVLAELDKENLAARLREARAGMMSAQANQKAAQAQYEKNKVEAEGPDVPFYRRNLQRAEQLFKDGLVPQQSYDEARTNLEQAENRQNVARSQLSVSQARIAQAQADVAQAQAAVDRAQEELNNATIRSPINGMVLSRDVEVGSPVSSILNMGAAATPIMVLGDIRQVFVRGKVDEADIGVVRLGQPARIRVETFKNRQFEGRVTQISPLGVEKDNVINFEVKVSIDNPGGELRANMTANAEIVLEEHKGSLTIPESAIIYDAKRNASVEVPDPVSQTGRKKISIKTGISNGTRTEVLAGLNLGDKVVLQ